MDRFPEGLREPKNAKLTSTSWPAIPIRILRGMITFGIAELRAVAYVGLADLLVIAPRLVARVLDRGPVLDGGLWGRR